MYLTILSAVAIILMVTGIVLFDTGRREIQKQHSYMLAVVIFLGCLGFIIPYLWEAVVIFVHDALFGSPGEIEVRSTYALRQSLVLIGLIVNVLAVTGYWIASRRDPRGIRHRTRLQTADSPPAGNDGNWRIASLPSRLPECDRADVDYLATVPNFQRVAAREQPSNPADY